VSDHRSVLTRPAPDPDEVVAYGELPDQVVEVYRAAPRPSGPSGPGAAPLLVFLHGGFWREEHDRRHVRPLAATLATDGWQVVLVEYRRVGGAGGWPATFDDVSRALTWVRDRWPDGEATLAGHSAGGHLALWAGSQPDVGRWSRLVALAPVADLLECDRRHLDDDAARALLGGGPQEHPQRWLAADPVRRPTPTTSVVLVHDPDDPQVPYALSLSYVAAHPAAQVVDVAGGHFGVIDPEGPAWSTVRQALAVP
jgi:acetyl esterase/lipase